MFLVHSFPEMRTKTALVEEGVALGNEWRMEYMSHRQMEKAYLGVDCFFAAITGCHSISGAKCFHCFFCACFFLLAGVTAAGFWQWSSITTMSLALNRRVASSPFLPAAPGMGSQAP